MKHILLGCALTAVCIAGFSQSTFVKVYDNWSRSEMLLVDQTSDGGFILAGQSSDETYTTEMRVIKTNKHGDILWTYHQYTPDHAPYPDALFETSDGNFLIKYTKYDSIINRDYSYLLTLTHDGDSISTIQYPHLYNYNQRFCHFYPDGSTAMAWHTLGPDWPFVKDYVVSRTNTSGEEIRTNIIEDLNQDADFYDMAIDNESIILSGCIDDHYSESGSNDGYLVKIDSSGNIIQDLTITGIGLYNSTSDSNDIIVAGGYPEDIYDWNSDFIGFKIAKINKELEIQWMKTFMRYDDEDIVDIVMCSDNGIIITLENRYYYGSSGTLRSIKFSAEGDSLWSSEIFNDARLLPTSVIQLADGAFAMAGTYDTHLPYQEKGMLIITNDSLELPFANLSGTVYYDDNDNMVYDSGDLGIPDQMIKTDQGPFYAATDSSGNYIVSVYNMGAYQITASDPLYFHQTSPPDPFYQVAEVDSFYSSTGSLNFAKNANSDIDDLEIDIHGTDLVPGFPVMYTVTINNLGTVVADSYSVSVTHNPMLTLDSMSVAYDSYTDNTISWNFSDLGLFESKTFNIYLTLSADTSLIDSTMLTYAYVSDTLTDFAPENNSIILTQVIHSSFDPNNKEVMPAGETNAGYIDPATPALTYTINFQNTGNYPATFVTLIDTLDYHLNFASLRTLSSSHNYTVEFVYPNIVKWHFDDINLPDSSVDMMGSQGYVKFEADILPDMPLNTTIENFADIYFDFNPPVRTNTVKNTLALPTSVTGIADAEIIYLYPNPATDALYLNISDVKNISVIIYSIAGETVKTINNLNINKIDITGLTNGIYLYSIQKEGNRIANGKLIKFNAGF